MKMSNLALEMNNVSMHYPHFDLKDVSFSMEKGTIMGLIGPNGAGKSTSIRILMGLLYPDSGAVNVLGHNMITNGHEARWKIGYASEDLRLYKGMTIGWHMHFIQRMFSDWDPNYARDLLSRFNLNPEQKVKGLSHGQRVKASLILILARHPDLLILDEPTTGLDPVARMETLDEMMSVLVDEERSVLFSSHNTADVEQLSDHITFIDNGTVVNSNDKETYLEAWRRIRINTDDSVDLTTLTGVTEQKKAGSSVVLLTNQYSDDLIDSWKTKGITINAIEMLTLEEIFLAEVKAARKGDQS
jgi:ABC-2 type transport system ATP-binding protein